MTLNARVFLFYRGFHNKSRALVLIARFTDRAVVCIVFVAFLVLRVV